jgi:hypothetical protein
VASVLPFAESAQLPVGGYRNIARWHDRLNQFDAWRAPFAGLVGGMTMIRRWLDGTMKRAMRELW